MDNDVTTSENQTQEQSEEIKTKEQPKTEEQPKTKEEQPTVTKQIEKMRKRIDREVGQRKESEDENKQLKEQVETLTEKIKTQQDDPDTKKSKNPELDKAKSENDKLKAQLVRRDQMDQVAQQFNEAGVVIPKNVLNMVVPAGIDDKQVSANMKALSSFYDSIVAGVKKEFLSAPTPRTTGSDNKPFDRNQLRKIKNPVERVKLIKEHLDDFK
ncbi:DUF4355 domain-containing protein [Lactobacillus helveticus]|uniref:DUF4355 domain-containing protein n=1 Tax=Lactobacillus helveticus TaxID=1587 RepID=UPI001562C5AF|nr:DUF4355 domain-containing protein [Lactobacillus helveticus]NRN88422.1 hypothetical protein [Lactobacillus helveticus]NRN92679.1 hypothetical protein [Lactobacillus helveticus]